MKTKGHRRNIPRRIVIGAIIVLVFIAGVAYMVGDFLLIQGFVFVGGRDMQRKQVRLLYKTDHEALLKACRELSKRVATKDLNPGTYEIRGEPDPEAASFPKAILDLGPNYVHIDENMTGRVKLEMFGGFAHFGVQAYPVDYKKPSWAEYGNKELIPGLWYYDDGYDENPTYEKTIEALRPRSK